MYAGSAFAWTEYFENGRPKAVFLQKLKNIREILQSGGRTAAQGALAWLWAKSDGNIPIPGFKTVKQVEENTGAMAFGPFEQRTNEGNRLAADARRSITFHRLRI